MHCYPIGKKHTLCFSFSAEQLLVASDASFWRPTTENSLKHFSHLQLNYFKFLSTYQHVILSGLSENAHLQLSILSKNSLQFKIQYSNPAC